MNSRATLKSKCAVGRWHFDWGTGTAFLIEGDRQIRVDSIGLRKMEDTQAVSVYCEFQKWEGDWKEVPADPHQHYLLVGPPEHLEQELWDLFDTVTSPEHFSQIEDALARGENVQSTTVFYGDANDAYIGADASYSWYTACAMTNSPYVVTGDVLRFGTKKDGATQKYQCWESFIAFNTASLGTGVIVSAVSLELRGATNRLNVGDWTLQARVHDWGSTVTTGDIVSPGTMLNETLFAFRPSSWGWSTTGYNVFAPGSGATAAVNRTGYTRLVLASAAHISQVPYSFSGGWLQYCECYSANKGTGYLPKLTVTYAVPTAPPPSVEDDPDKDPVWVTTWEASLNIDYDKRVIWPTNISSDAYATAGQVILNCEEGVAAEERSLVDSSYPLGRTPIVNAYFDYLIPVPVSGLPMPAAQLVLALPYKMPEADHGLLTVFTQLTVGSWTGGDQTIVLPHTNNEVMVYGISVLSPGSPPLIWGTCMPGGNLWARIKITAYTGSGTKIYPLPIDVTGTVPCSHLGLAPDQGVTVWDRAQPVVIMESPPAGSHANPTFISGLPVLKLSADGLYPNDIVTVKAYADSKRSQGHDKLASKVLIDTADVETFSVAIMPSHTLRRTLEIGHSPYFLDPPDAVRDNAPTAVKWLPNRTYAVGDIVRPTFLAPNFYAMAADADGISGSEEPDWPTDGSTVADNTCIWSDAGERFTYGTNTYYEVSIVSASGTPLVGEDEITLEALLDVLNPRLIDGIIDAPQVRPIADCDTETEIVLAIDRPASYGNELPLKVVFEVTYPDGSIRLFDAGKHDEFLLGRVSIT